MNGYLILRNDDILAQGKYWFENDGSAGFLWTESEKDSILEESKSWQFKPTHIQKAVLLAGKITRYEKITL